MVNYPLPWFKYTKTQEEKDKLILLLGNNSVLFGLIDNILQEKIDELIKQQCNTADFDGDWSHKQAFRNGRLSTLRELKDLITFKGRP